MRPLHAIFALLCVFAVLFTSQSANAQPDEEQADEPLRLAIAGLVHGHVEGALWHAMHRDDIQLVAVYDPDDSLYDKHKHKYGLVDARVRWFGDLEQMLERAKPEAVCVMTSTKDHARVVEHCAERGIHVMLEKPLATTVEDAEKIAGYAREHDIHVVTNYETSWYASVHVAMDMVEGRAMWPLRRADFRHGHKGPVEIGCSPEFLGWLTDPVENGAGALFDFGCYGVNISTHLAGGELPTSVTCVTQQRKPDLYPNVDDDATIVLTYDGPRGGWTSVVQASWAWTHDNKEMDLHTERGSLHAGKWAQLLQRAPDAEDRKVEIPDRRPPPYDNQWSYLRALVRGECEVDPLSSIDNNVKVVRILEAARRSAKTGQTITLQPDRP